MCVVDFDVVWYGMVWYDMPNPTYLVRVYSSGKVRLIGIEPPTYFDHSSSPRDERSRLTLQLVRICNSSLDLPCKYCCMPC